MDASRLHEVLTAWVDQLTEVAPTRDDVARFVESSGQWPAQMSAAATRRRPAFEWFARQVSFGITGPLSLPPYLREPAPGEEPRSAPDALVEWYRAHRDDTELSGVLIKESRLRAIARQNLTSSDIVKQIPGITASVAAAMVEVIRGVTGQGAGAATGGDSAAVQGRGAAAAPFTPASRPPEAEAAVRDTGSAPPGGAPVPPPPPVGAETPSQGVAPSPTSAPRLTVDLLAPYVVAAQPAPGPLTAGQTATSTTLSWAPSTAPGAVHLYRVVSSDTAMPFRPDTAEQVALTDSARALDERPRRAPLRHYQVWRSSGATVDDALAAQPVLHAQASTVTPLRSPDLRAEEGQVVAQWAVQPGLDSVHVYRIPREQAAAAGLSPQHRILPERDNRGGFVDVDVSPGAAYVYRLVAQISDDAGQRYLSQHIDVEVVVPAVLRPVLDLAVHVRGSERGTLLDLTWTPPQNGDVVIYRTPAAPSIADEVRPVSALDVMGLTRETKQLHPIQHLPDGRVHMEGIPWPHGWARSYFTPVTVLGGDALPGRTETATAVQPPGRPKLVERIDRQILTFEWPEAAALVDAFVGPRGSTVEQVGTGGAAQVTEASYRETGGLLFSPPLMRQGCTVHLQAVAYDDGERIQSPAVQVDYPGLQVLSYTVEVIKQLLVKPVALKVTVMAERSVDGVEFVMVHHPDRLPLDVRDGEALAGRLEAEEGVAPAVRLVPRGLSPDLPPARWVLDLRQGGRSRRGWFRLFANYHQPHAQPIALLDPPAGSLQVEG